MTDRASSAEADDQSLGVEIGRALRRGDPDVAGSCQDCGGMGVVPSLDLTRKSAITLWRSCPTCRGIGQGGRA